MRLPCRWDAVLQGFQGCVRFRRRFGRPANLDPWEQVWLVCEGADYVSQWTLNGTELGRHVGAFTPFEFDISHCLATRNELAVEVACPGTRLLPPGEPVVRGTSDPCGGLWGTVAIEIRHVADLADLCVTTQGRSLLRIEARVRLRCPRELELYVLLDDRLLAYLPLSGSPGEQPLQQDLRVENVRDWWSDPRPHLLRLELVSGAVRVYQNVLPVGFRSLDAEAAQHAEIVELSAPVREWPALDEADASGRPLRIRLPAATSLTGQVCSQYRSILRHLAHHPCVVGWVVGSEEIAALAAQWDPTRPVRVERGLP
jgi:beta-glucuronidase